MRTALLSFCLCSGWLLIVSPAPAVAAQAKQRARPAAPTTPAPNPKLTPQQVVGIVLTALQHNDKQDSGIATTFRFASPGNRRATGPLGHFIQMVKTPAYRPMLNFKSAARSPVQVRGDQARQQVTITTAGGEKIRYLFALSRQKAAPYAGCWMTDAVLRAPRPAPPPSTTSRLLRPH